VLQVMINLFLTVESANKNSRK